MTQAASRPHATIFECPDAVGAGKSADAWRLVPLSNQLAFGGQGGWRAWGAQSPVPVYFHEHCTQAQLG